jgi:hypothetical protein
MSYSLTIELSPHADAAKSITIYTKNAAGVHQIVGRLHEAYPRATISVPPGCVLVLVDNMMGSPHEQPNG